MILTGSLETPRLLLRSMRPSDASQRYLSWLQDSEINRYLEVRFAKVTDISGLAEFIQSANDSADSLLMGIFLKSDERHIGNIKLGPIVYHHARSDIGYLIGERSCWGKGLATEAITAVARYGLSVLNLAKITAGCYEPNQGSARALQKAGFVHQATIPSLFVYEGRRVASLIYGLDR